MIVQGNVTSLKPLPEKNGKEGKAKNGLYQLSIEGFGVLVKSNLLAKCPDSGEVVARVSVNWQAGKRPVYWLQQVRQVELKPLA